MIIKQSKQRDLIRAYMKQMDGHVSAEKIFEDLKQAGHTISLATVYRNLNILSQLNEIKKIAHPVNGYVYDKTCTPHDHMYCVKCGAFLDVSHPYQTKADIEMEMQSGWHMITHSTIFEGICLECMKKNRT